MCILERNVLDRLQSFYLCHVVRLCSHGWLNCVFRNRYEEHELWTPHGSVDDCTTKSYSVSTSQSLRTLSTIMMTLRPTGSTKQLISVPEELNKWQEGLPSHLRSQLI